MTFFNENLKLIGSRIPPLREIDEEKVAAANAVYERFGEEKFEKGVWAAMRNGFLNGNGPNGWVASFDWIMNPANFAKILEGQYTDGRKSNKPKYD